MRVKVAKHVRSEALCRQMFGKHAEQTAVLSCVVEDDEIRGLALKWSQQVELSRLVSVWYHKSGGILWPCFSARSSAARSGRPETS